MTGYTRKDTTNNIADGNVINAADLDNEFDGLQTAFSAATGHTHGGTTGDGAPITTLGPTQDVTISASVLGVKTTNTVDLGTSSLKFKDFYLAGAASIGGALTYGGVTLSNAVTGTGNMVLSASPTLTGTITAAAANFSGAVALNGNTTLGDADTDTITQAASYVTGTQLKSAKTATNTLSLAAYDVDGTAYTNLITLTASNTPTLALTSTGVGTINNMSIGATTASTGAFTTLSASSTVSGTGFSTYLASPPAIGGTAAAAGSFTTLSALGTTTLSGNQIISVTDNTNAALRITQLGTGNALLVEDDTNPDSTPFVIDAIGEVGIGVTSPIYPLDMQANSSAFSLNIRGRSADGISLVRFARNNNTDEEVRLVAYNDGAFAIANTASQTERMRIDSSGNVGIGTSSPASGLNLIDALSGGQLLVATNQTNATEKYGTFGTQHYTNAEEPVLGVAVQSNVTDNNILIGGALGEFNAATQVRFYTAANNTTVTGTERMRIDSSGNVGIGTSAAVSGVGVNINKTITGATTSYGMRSIGQIQSDVTSNARYFATAPSTQATAFTLGSLSHYYAEQGTFGAGSVVTNQYGFVTASSLTGATNNYGFYGNIASATGAWNLYMNGTADNYLAGKTGIGGTASVGQILRVGGSVTGSTSSRQIIANGVVASDVTARADSFYSTPQTAASAFTLGILSHFHAAQSTIGSGSAVTTQIGFEADSSITGATTNIGFYGDIASGTGRWNLYMAGTANNYMAGSLGIGTTSFNANLDIGKTITGGTSWYGIRQNGAIQSDVTSGVQYNRTVANTAAAAFTLSNLWHYIAVQSTIGAGSAITNQYGYAVDATLTGATNNYGFHSNIASGTGRYNFYAAGTADNYFAGNVGIGTSSPANKLTLNSGFVQTGNGVGGGGGVWFPYSSDASGRTWRARTDIAGYGDFGFEQSTTQTGTAFATKLLLDQSGNLSVGGTDAGVTWTTSKLFVNGGYTQLKHSDGPLLLWNTTNTGTRTLVIFDSTVGSTRTDVGSITYNGTNTLYNATSDVRLKENIVDADSGLNKLKNIKIRSFDWKQSGLHTDFGVIAQEIKEIAPEVVAEGEDNEDGSIKRAWAVDTSALVPAMIKAIQELKAINDTQAETINALTARVVALESN